MTLVEKLLTVQQAVDAVVRTELNKSDNYKFVSSEAVLEAIRPKMNELGLLLEIEISDAQVHVGETKSGTTRYLTEMRFLMRWVNTDDPKDYRELKWYAQGVDLAGEKGPGKGATYAEKYFLLKYFHVPTPKDDPDAGQNQQAPKARAKTQAGKETAVDCRAWSLDMLGQLFDKDPVKITQSIRVFSRYKAPDGATVEHDRLEDISDAAMPVVYARIKDKYRERFGKEYEKRKEEDMEQ